MSTTYFIYILYSPVADRYYAGYSRDPFRRLIEHNTKPFTTFTSKHRPWILRSVFRCGTSEAKAKSTEKFLKAQKSRTLLDKLCDPIFTPVGRLAHLVRVPHVRD